MVSTDDKLTRIVSRVALLVALAVALVLPLGFWIVAYRDFSGELEFKARVKATALSGMIATNPTLWMYAENRLLGLLAREPVPLDTEMVTVYDPSGSRLAQVGNVPPAPALSRSHLLHDAARVAGRVEVSDSLRPTMVGTALAAAVGLALGVAVFVALRTYPLRALRRVTGALFEQKQRAEVTLRSIGDAVITTDAATHVEFLNPSAERLTGWELAEARGRPVTEILQLVDSVSRSPVAVPLRRAFAENRAVSIGGDTDLVRRDGSRVGVDDNAAPIHDPEGNITGGVLILRDVSANRDLLQRYQQAAEQAEYLASYDHLTALPNRGLFSRLLNQAISLARRNRRQVAVLFLDLDRFKNINDTLGHDAGDLLLQEVGKRVKSCLRDSDTVARLGGDEFVVVLPDLLDSAYVEVVANKILATTARSFVALAQEFHVTASIGISTYPADGEDEQTLMKNADIAMYQAKAEGRNVFRFYSAHIDTHSFERLALESSLRRALERKEFLLHYQPKIDARDGTIIGTEALLRWQHPDLGMVAPAKFIPVAEETGLIVSIGMWVLRTACIQNLAWQRQGLAHLNIAVNLSGRQFSDDDLLQDITDILAETGMSPGLLELEITESTLMRDVGKAMVTLRAFRDMGLRLAIDDFGTGYSSLSTLSRFPIDTIKIDGSFIRDLSERAENRGITGAIITMGRTLSLNVIAEHVETKAQVDFLREHACDEFQGFFFSPAVDAGELARLLQGQAERAAQAAQVALES